MAGRHGWAGAPPADEREARRRIIEAARRCVGREDPARFTRSDVAADLGVIRRTVYRCYPRSDDLLSVVGPAAGESFAGELTRHCRPGSRSCSASVSRGSRWLSL